MEAQYSFIISILISLILTLILGYPFIPFLRRIKAGQSIRECGPQSHLTKAGTPTMGGLFLIVAVVITTLFMDSFNQDTIILVAAILLFGGIGFIDDFIKVVLKRNLGLRAYQKLTMQIIIAVGLAIYQSQTSDVGTSVYIPFANINVDFGIFYIPFIVFFVVAMVNGVNLTDGLDGLAAGITMIIALFLGITALGINQEGISVYAGALVGACLGFLKYNKKPALVFMGDTGSLALGGAVAAIAILMNITMIIPIVGGIYVAEVVSVIIQVGYFKRTGKRFFRMAPIHHHFEEAGWDEKKVVRVFWSVTLGLCIFGALVIW